MNIIISNASNQPIYEQIYNQLKNSIIMGDLQEEDLLPSIRNLAKDLKISVITTKRAYEELERDGYIYSVPGKGSYVAKKNTELIKECYLKEIEDLMQKIYDLSTICEISDEELFEMFALQKREEEKQ